MTVGSKSSLSDSILDQPQLIAQDTINSDPNFYFTKYLRAYIQETRELVVLRQSVSKASAFNTVKPSQVCYTESDAIKIKMEGTDKTFPLSSIEKVELDEVSGPFGPVNFISITIKGDRNPLILHGPPESMELWCDALSILKGIKCELKPTSQTKMDVFIKAIEFLKEEQSNDFIIPPPPKNLNFSSSFTTPEKK